MVKHLLACRQLDERPQSLPKIIFFLIVVVLSSIVVLSVLCCRLRVVGSRDHLPR